ncbi:TPM domain-containing protein [Sphingomonas sp. BIUV-7]|uniref:TPM domain-containing protein n=1 Tax=Sphingomonas natans TaxID=3063330 RepID=A0ABT8Y6R8_9SPHN|nr:TPM domain-containing protein [Sphingomonas sp. BIUV-7]MDO6414018.1 TPM domain-containing protein [Sphingomonas sp. BIUV-7]
MVRNCLLAVLTLASWANPSIARSASAVPRSLSSSLAFTGFVVDEAHLLSANERALLTNELDRFQQRTAHQLAVVTVSRLDGEDIAIFTRRLANRWGVGRRGANDGVLLLVAPHERKVRIEVGRGLERRLTNRYCQTVLATKVIPAFRQGRLGAGIRAGVAAIIGKLSADAR